MTGVDVAIASFERDAEEDERYLKANCNSPCGDCNEFVLCPCGECGYGWCRHMDDHFGDEGFRHESEHAVRDYECPHFEERKDNE